jgi:PAS domain S-box-containing protein
MSAIAVKTFGRLLFEDGAGDELRTTTRKTAALAIYLAMQPEKRFSREFIAGLLWGDKDEANARHSLSQSLTDLRRALGADVINVDSQHVWSPRDAAEVDALKLTKLARSHAKDDLEAVERIYQGDFLSGFDLGQETFDDWVTAERERLRRSAHVCMTELLALKVRSSEYRAAIETAHGILAIEPFDETAHRAIMRSLAQGGFPRRALDHYKAFSADLRRELGVGPDAVTVETYEEILNGSMSPSKYRTLSAYVFVLEQLPYPVTVTDLENRIVGWNRLAEEALGFSKAEMLGRSPTEIYAPDHDSALADDILQKAIEGGRWVGEPALIAKDGSVHRQRRVVVPLFGAEGEFIGAFGHGLPINS